MKKLIITHDVVQLIYHLLRILNTFILDSVRNDMIENLLVLLLQASIEDSLALLPLLFLLLGLLLVDGLATILDVVALDLTLGGLGESLQGSLLHVSLRSVLGGRTSGRR